MKKILKTLSGKKPLTRFGLIIATIIVYGGIGLMALLYICSPTISGERLF